MNQKGSVRRTEVAPCTCSSSALTVAVTVERGIVGGRVAPLP